MGIREEGLPVVALRGEAGGQQREDELVGVHGGGLGEHLDRGVVEADLVVLDRVPVNADRELEVPVLDDVAGGGEVLDFAVADPLPHSGDVPEPGVGFGVGGGRGDGGDLLVERLDGVEGLVEQGVKPDIDAPQILGIDNHDLIPPIFGCQDTAGAV